MSYGRYGLPLEVKYCVRCVISNQRPSSVVEFAASSSDRKQTINFNEDGVCDACLFNDTKEFNIDWAAREQELFRLAEQYDKIPGYNVVVPGSGGKDSAFTSHVLKYKFGFRPLTVTWSPHLYTDIGRQNFDSWIHEGGFDNILFTPNGRLHRHLTKLAFQNLLHPFQPFIIGQRLIGPKIAAKFGIPLIFYGENQAEYGNKVSENSSPLMREEFFSGEAANLRFGGESIKSILESTSFGSGDFEPYLPLSSEELRQKQIEVRYLGYYLKWDPQECYYYAVENTGFLPNPSRTEGSYSKYSSLDDKIDPFHYYTTLAKFGLGRASYDAAQEIRNGKITREEGVELVRKFDLEFPEKYFEEFLSYIDISRGEFSRLIDAARPEHLWKEKNGTWDLKHPVWGER
jgi:N-acetyl sugar amidotransferase